MIWCFIGIPDDSQDNFVMWVFVAFLGCHMVGTACGIMFSTLFSRNMDAIISANFFLGGCYLCAGMFSNLRNRQNWFLDFCTFVSPFTYSCECFMLLLLKGIDEQDRTRLLDFYNMDKGMDYCLQALFNLWLAFFCIGWMASVLKTRYEVSW